MAFGLNEEESKKRAKEATEGVIEAAKQIRSRFNIPVVYLTAYSDEKILNRAKLTEPFGYIIKPFKERELKMNIEIALYKHKMETLLKESKEFYESVLEGIVNGIWVTDKNDVNSYMKENLGLKTHINGKRMKNIDLHVTECCIVLLAVALTRLQHQITKNLC
jgi:CheY-like chemotaxis protein